MDCLISSIFNLLDSISILYSFILLVNYKMNDIQTVKEYIKKHQYLNNNTKGILIEEILNIELDIEKLKINLYEIETVNNKLNHYLKEMISFNNQLQ